MISITSMIIIVSSICVIVNLIIISIISIIMIIASPGVVPVALAWLLDVVGVVVWVISDVCVWMSECFASYSAHTDDYFAWFCYMGCIREVYGVYMLLYGVPGGAAERAAA